MTEETFDPKLPLGFQYSIKNGEMVINFFCDCCGDEIKVSKRLQQKIKEVEQSFKDVFEDLKEELDGQFHRCKDCGFLICDNCWDIRETKCKDCPVCITGEETKA